MRSLPPREHRAQLARLRAAKGKDDPPSPQASGGKIAKDSLRSKNTARLYDIVSFGKIGGLIDGLKSFYIIDGSTQTPILAANGTTNIEGVTIEERLGTPGQAHFAGFSAVEYEVSISAEVKQATPVVRTITDEDLDAIRVKLRWPQIVSTSGGNINGASMEMVIDVAPFGGSFVEVKRDTFSGKTGSPYEREHRIALPSGGAPWSIRVRRITADSDATTEYDSFWWSYTAIIDAKLRYPDIAGYLITVDGSQYADRVPGRAFRLRGIECEVPTNYDPIAGTYATTGPGTTAGIWDGTFKRASTECPPWILRDLMLEQAYGTGDDVEAAAVDKWALYDIAQYCDGRVPNGRGGFEKRYTINTQIMADGDAHEIFNAIAAAFRGFTYWAAGAVFAVQSRPMDPFRSFGPAKVVAGSFDRASGDLMSEHSVCTVWFNDPADGFKQTPVQWIDRGRVKRLGWKSIELTKMGCTSEGEAMRLAKWTLEMEKSFPISFRVGQEDADVSPGDVALITDPVMAGANNGGNVVASSTTGITTDRTVSLTLGVEYTAVLTMPAGEPVYRILTNEPGETTELAWADPLDDVPNVNSFWLIMSDELMPEQVQIIAALESGPTEIEFATLSYDPTMEARVEQNLYLPAPKYSNIPTGPLAPPRNLTISSITYHAGASLVSSALLSWTAAKDSRVVRYELQVQPANEPNFTIVDYPNALTYDLFDIEIGVLNFRIRSLDAVGNHGDWVAASAIVGDVNPAADVTNLRINVVGETAHLSWDPIDTTRVKNLVVKFQPVLSGATWGAASILVPQVLGTSVAVPAMIGSYLVKAITFGNKESINAAIVASNVAGLTQFNAVETLEENPEFPGTKTFLALYDDELMLEIGNNMSQWEALADVITLAFGDEGALREGLYEFSEIVDLLDIYPCRITPVVEAYGINVNNNMAGWARLSDLTNLAGLDPGDWDATIQISTTNGDPESSPPGWTDWQSMTVGDYTARAFRFRARVRNFDPNVTVAVRRLKVIVDVPDRMWSVRNVICPEGGMWVDIDPPYRVTPAITINGFDLDGAKWVVNEESPSRFYVEFFLDGVSVSRRFDAITKGDGTKQ